VHQVEPFSGRDPELVEGEEPAGEIPSVLCEGS
jgi:hypothetical protein